MGREGDFNAALRKVMMVDLRGLKCLVAAVLLRYLGGIA
jgi:hypothetical protein